MREGTRRDSHYCPGTDHWPQADFDHRPAQVYVQAMAAVQAQKLGGVAAILSRFATPRRPSL